jgi:hypothetical protein
MRDLTLTRNLDDVARVHDWLRERGQERICLLGSWMDVADGDHRLTDRKDRLWELTMEFLQGRRLL